MPSDPQQPATLFAVRLTDWATDVALLSRVRHEVFIVEQRIPEALEWDADDVISLHALAEDRRGNAVGCGRLLADGHIGRMAVLSEWRGRGVGGALLATLVAAAAARGHRRLVLRAQTHALLFYQRHGFLAFGDEFVEAGIPHRAMERQLG